MNMTADMMAVTNLYDRSLVRSSLTEIAHKTDISQYCDDCFLLMMKQRLMSPFLSESDHTDYLIEQFDSIQQNCSTTMPYTTTKNTMYLGIATASKTSQPTATPVPTSCGQDQQSVNATSPNMPCEVIARNFNVSTGAVVLAANDEFCQFNETICLPLPCITEKIYNGTW
jgi:hypothetical protein